MKRLLCYLLFAVLMTVIIAGSTVVVVALYLPFVALKAGWVAVTTLLGSGRARPGAPGA